MMKNIQMRAMPLLFSLHFPSFVLSFVHGLQNPVGGQTPPDSMALFYALFPKSRVFLGCLLGYYCIQCLPGVADMSKRKLKAASGSYAVLNTRRFLFQRVQFRQRRSCIMEMALIFNEFIFTPVTHQNSLWIRSSELAKALGYSDDRKVGVLYARHKDEFSNNMSVVLNLSTTDVPAMNRIFSLRGCHLVAMLARTPIAKAFRRWVLDVIEQYGDRVPVAEPVTLNDELISASERAELKLIVDAKLSTYPAAVQGKARAEIWAKFNRHFRIAGPAYARGPRVPAFHPCPRHQRHTHGGIRDPIPSASRLQRLRRPHRGPRPPRRGMDRIRGGNPLPAPPIRQRALARQGEHLSRTSEPGMFPAEHLEGSASRHPAIQLVQRPDVD